MRYRLLFACLMLAAADTTLKLAAEQYAGIDTSKQQLVTSRRPRAFVSALPPAFRDHLARVPGVKTQARWHP